MSNDKRNSYTAASQFPLKVLLETELMDSISNHKKITPVHVQFSPTNTCNLNCSFCSCSKRDKKLQLTLDKSKVILKSIRTMGCKAITITGGGEPLMHPDINEIIIYAKFMQNMDVGLVTNGLLLERLNDRALHEITWCRISFSDSRTFDDKFINSVMNTVKRGNNIDWAFSYVVSRNPNYNKIKQIIELANSLEFTHVRLVSDLLDLDKGADMDLIKSEMKRLNVDDSLVIYQGRKKFVPGHKQCLISLLKPMIDASGNVTACCGWQYRHKKPSLNFDSVDCMGTYKDLPEIIEKQQCYDGSKCYRCYYAEYNELLNILMDGIKHKNFV